MENVLFMEETSGFHDTTKSPATFSDSHENIDFSQRYLQGMQLLYHLYSYFLV